MHNSQTFRQRVPRTFKPTAPIIISRRARQIKPNSRYTDIFISASVPTKPVIMPFVKKSLTKKGPPPAVVVTASETPKPARRRGRPKSALSLSIASSFSPSVIASVSTSDVTLPIDITPLLSPLSPKPTLPALSLPVGVDSPYDHNEPASPASSSDLPLSHCLKPAGPIHMYTDFVDEEVTDPPSPPSPAAAEVIEERPLLACTKNSASSSSVCIPTVYDGGDGCGFMSVSPQPCDDPGLPSPLVLIDKLSPDQISQASSNATEIMDVMSPCDRVTSMNGNSPTFAPADTAILVGSTRRTPTPELIDPHSLPFFHRPLICEGKRIRKSNKWLTQDDDFDLQTLTKLGYFTRLIRYIYANISS